jgi:molybdopterin synthase catalytic subunit
MADGRVRAVTGLDYEAYVELAEQRMAELAHRTAERWPDLCAVWAEHRVGRLAVGDTAVVVAVSSPHRHTAFDAARHLIDELKATVPIWKREHWADGGAHWPGTD